MSEACPPSCTSYISLLTMSEDSPVVLMKTRFSSTTGVTMRTYP